MAVFRLKTKTKNQFKEEKKNIGITYVSKFTETCSKIEAKSELRKKRIMKKKKNYQIKENEIETEFTWNDPVKKYVFCTRVKKFVNQRRRKKAEKKLARS